MHHGLPLCLLYISLPCPRRPVGSEGLFWFRKSRIWPFLREITKCTKSCRPYLKLHSMLHSELCALFYFIVHCLWSSIKSSWLHLGLVRCVKPIFVIFGRNFGIFAHLRDLVEPYIEYLRRNSGSENWFGWPFARAFVALFSNSDERTDGKS